jgi:Pyruvate/2-oxoacid:ferredoxin oxidoreductase gamma subunit
MAIKNIIIAGIGGQGINTLAKVLAETFLTVGYTVQFTVHKGGAQSLGTVYAEMRLLKNSASAQTAPILGAGIPVGTLDILIALEPWEAIRHVGLSHKATQLYVDATIQPLFNDRKDKARQAISQQDPVAQLNQLPLTIHWKDYRQQAKLEFGTVNMANYLAGLDCLDALELFSDAKATNFFKSAFFNTIQRVEQPI